MARALLVIDVQREYESGALPIEHPPLAEGLTRIGAAMDRAYAAGVLVVVVRQDMPPGAPVFARGGTGAQVHPEVAARPRHHLVTKTLPGAFAGTGLREWLRERDVDTITLAGYMTQHCVDSTARQGMHAGFRVEVLADATGCPAYANAAGRIGARELHEGALIALHAGIAAVGTTAEWLAVLGGGGHLPIGDPVSSAAAARATTGAGATPRTRAPAAGGPAAGSRP